jgi:hypothetical protein
MPIKTLPEITEKQQNIIELVFKFRFINRKQIQQIFKHKDAHRINSWLKDLVEKNYLGRIYSHRLLENTKPAVYYLNNYGVLWCKENMGWNYRHDEDCLSVSEIKKFYEDKHASETFRNHCINICDIYLKFQNLNNGCEYDCSTKTELWTMQRNDADFQEKKNYIPDMIMEKDNPDEKSWSSFFLDLIDPHVPRYALQYKVKQYIKYCEQEDWSQYASKNNKFPTIIFVFPNQQKLNRLVNFIQQRLNESYSEDISFILTTQEKMTIEGIRKQSIWKIIENTNAEV